MTSVMVRASRVIAVQSALLVLLGLCPSLGAQPLTAGAGWQEIPNTRLQSVCPPNGFGGSGYDFADRCRAVTGAWNSAVLDKARNRLIIWGGGHTDYLGNELYALDLNSFSVQRLTDPGLPVAVSGCPESLVNGTQPNSRHTYDGITYMDHVDRMFVFGGSLSPCGFMSNGTWTFSFASSTWEKRNPRGPKPRAEPGAIAVYDPVSRKVFVHDSSTLYSYDFDSDKYTDLSSGGAIDYHMSGVIHPVRRNLVIIGAGRAYIYDIGAKSGHSRRTLKTKGGEPIVDSGYPGLAYDPASDRIVAWNGGNSVYSLDLDRKTWTALPYPDGPGTLPTTGTFKRWNFSAASGIFILVDTMGSNAFAFRLGRPDGGGSAHRPDRPVK
jgi:hypothetical protein